MYEELVKALRETRERVRQHPDVAMYVPPYQLSAAADAIDELSRRAAEWEVIAESWQKACEGLEGRIPRWVSVAERLPEKYTHNLVYSNETGIDILYFGSRGLFQDYHSDEIKGITHWMQLPAPPREEA